MSRAREREFVPADPTQSRIETLLSQGGRELFALFLIGLCLYSLLSIATFGKGPVGAAGGEVGIPSDGLQNAGGLLGYGIAYGFLFVFGLAAYVPFLFLLAYGLLVFVGRGVDRLVFKALGIVVLTAMLAVLLTPDQIVHSPSFPFGVGGRFGQNISSDLYEVFGGSGRLLLLLFGALFALLLATGWALSNLFLRSARGALAGLVRTRGFLARRSGSPALAQEADDHNWASGLGDAEEAEADEEEEEEEDEEEEEEEEEEDEEEEEEEEEVEEPPPPKARRPRKARGKQAVENETNGRPRGKKGKEPVVQIPRVRRRTKKKVDADVDGLGVQGALPFDKEYPFPPLDLFQAPSGVDDQLTTEQARECARSIERCLAAFKIEARVVGVAAGPAVTQYEIRLAEGIKVSRIRTYEADLSAALKAVSVRVVAPIPGRDTVGIEVPNLRRQIVVLRELLEAGHAAKGYGIPLYLGRDVAGDPIIEDLAKMPHLLIAGTTGSGKSVCINTILLSILMTRTPRQVRLILIDPKMVELQVYASVPHLACPVVTSMKKAPGVLEWAVAEMEKRYTLLSSARTNHIATYNRLGKSELEERLGRELSADEVEMPYTVLIIDELADLMSVAAKDVEDYILRLAQKSRAVGIHVVLATQRPSTDVVTGLIKANLPCTIAFKVNRKVDSRVVLDTNGAEKLLGHGDLLYIGPGAPTTVRAQGTFVSEDEIHRVVTYLADQGAGQSFIPSLIQTQTAAKRQAKARDELYEQAVEVIIGQQRGSATLLQRALSVGYTRATRLLELMEEDGLVGPYNGSRSREVLLTQEEWDAQEEGVEEELEAVAVAQDAGLSGDEDEDEFDDVVGSEDDNA